MLGLRSILTIFVFTHLQLAMAVAIAEEKTTTGALEKSYVICKNQKIVRTLRVEVIAGRCQAVYTKNGKDQIIGSGMNTQSCLKYAQNVRDTLIKNNWKCRDVERSAVSEVKEAAPK